MGVVAGLWVGVVAGLWVGVVAGLWVGVVDDCAYALYTARFINS